MYIRARQWDVGVQKACFTLRPHQSLFLKPYSIIQRLSSWSVSYTGYQRCWEIKVVTRIILSWVRSFVRHTWTKLVRQSLANKSQRPRPPSASLAVGHFIRKPLLICIIYLLLRRAYRIIFLCNSNGIERHDPQACKHRCALHMAQI
jgi:hypothetical protein